LIILFVLNCFRLSADHVSLADSIIALGTQLQPDTARIDFFIDEAWKFMYKDNRITEQILEEIETLNSSLEIPYKHDVVIYYHGVLNRRLGNFEKAKEYYQSYYAIVEKDTVYRKMANVQLALANLYYDFSIYDSSMVAANEALKIYDLSEDTLNYCKSLRKVANILRKMGRYDDAINYLDQCIEKSLSAKIDTEVAEAHNDKGIVYEKLNMVDSMFHYYLSYYDYTVETHNISAQVYSNYNLSVAYFEIEEYNKAIYFARNAKTAALATNDLGMLRYIEIMLGILKVKTGEIETGIALLEDLLLKDLSLDEYSSIYQNLTIAYESKGDYYTALQAERNFKIYADSIINLDVQQQIAELETEFASKEKTKEIDLLNTQNNLMLLELEKAEAQKLYFLFGLLGLSLIVFLLLRSNRLVKTNQFILKEKNRIVEESLKEKKSLLQEIHHRVKNNLQIISSLLSLQSRQLSDPIALEAIKDGRNRVKSMALIHQNLYEDDNLVGVNMAEYIDRLANSLIFNYKMDDLDVQLKTEVNDVQMSIDQIIPLGLILNELITNALKYAFSEKKSGLISIKLKEIDDLIVLEVLDDGVGLPKGFSIDQYDSLGFKLITSFTKKLKAKFEIKSPKIGTLIKIKIPQSNAA